MALITRISRLFKADFHAVLDQIEEPEQLLKQAIRDMQDEIAVAEQRIANREREQKSLQAHGDDLRMAAAELDDQLDLCFESGKDDLAKGLVRRKLETNRLLKRLSARIDSNEQFLADQRRFDVENRNALESLRQKAEVLAHQSSSTRTGSDGAESPWCMRDMSIGDDEVEVAFLREKARRSQP